MSSCTRPCAMTAFANAASATLARSREPMSEASAPPIAMAKSSARRLEGRSHACAAMPIMSARQVFAFATPSSGTRDALVPQIQRAHCRAMLVEVAISRYHHSQTPEEESRSVDARCVVDCRNVLGEGALWCPLESRLWWIDISSPSLWTWQPDARQAEHWPLPKPPGSFALRKDGGFLFAFRSGFATLDQPGGEVKWQ